MASIVARGGGKVITGDEWPEGTLASYDVAFEDEADPPAAYTPDSIDAIKVYNGAGDLLETFESLPAAAPIIAVTTAAVTNDIAAGDRKRHIFIEWTATTTRYTGVKQRCEIDYEVEDLIGEYEVDT